MRSDSPSEKQRDPAAEIPRILAVADVHVPVVAGTRGEAVISFYSELIGLHYLGPGERETELVFRGYPEVSPRLIVDLEARPPERWAKRVALIQVPSLSLLRERLDERRVVYEQLRGWLPCDRRLLVNDPGENLVELVASHLF